MLARDRIMELAEQLDAVLHEQPILISKARTISRQIVTAAEEHGATLKEIQDLARYGRPSVRTQRWIAAIEKDRPGAGTPGAA